MDTEGVNAQNQDIVSADDGTINITQDMKNSRLNNNRTTGIGFNLSLPYEIDTSYHVNVKIKLVKTSSSNGNIAYRFSYNTVRDGSIFGMFGTPSNVLSTTGISTFDMTTSGAGTQYTISLRMELPTYISDIDTVFFKFVRLGSDVLDTYMGNIICYSIVIESVSWCNGKYLGQF